MSDLPLLNWGLSRNVEDFSSFIPNPGTFFSDSFIEEKSSARYLWADVPVDETVTGSSYQGSQSY